MQDQAVVRDEETRNFIESDFGVSLCIDPRAAEVQRLTLC